MAVTLVVVATDVVETAPDAPGVVEDIVSAVVGSSAIRVPDAVATVTEGPMVRGGAVAMTVTLGRRHQLQWKKSKVDSS